MKLESISALNTTASLVESPSPITPPWKVTLPTKVDAPPTLKLVPEPNSRVCPLKVKLASSSISPPGPTITTRLSVKSSILNVSAWPPALISTSPLNVDRPDIINEVAVVKPPGCCNPFVPVYLYPTI